MTYTWLNKCNLAKQQPIQDFTLGCSKIYIVNKKTTNNFDTEGVANSFGHDHSDRHDRGHSHIHGLGADNYCFSIVLNISM